MGDGVLLWELTGRQAGRQADSKESETVRRNSDSMLEESRRILQNKQGGRITATPPRFDGDCTGIWEEPRLDTAKCHGGCYNVVCQYVDGVVFVC